MKYRKSAKLRNWGTVSFILYPGGNFTLAWKFWHNFRLWWLWQICPHRTKQCSLLFVFWNMFSNTNEIVFSRMRLFSTMGTHYLHQIKPWCVSNLPFWWSGKVFVPFSELCWVEWWDTSAFTAADECFCCLSKKIGQNCFVIWSTHPISISTVLSWLMRHFCLLSS